MHVRILRSNNWKRAKNLVVTFVALGARQSRDGQNDRLHPLQTIALEQKVRLRLRIKLRGNKRVPQDCERVFIDTQLCSHARAREMTYRQQNTRRAQRSPDRLVSNFPHL